MKKLMTVLLIIIICFLFYCCTFTNDHQESENSSKVEENLAESAATMEIVGDTTKDTMDEISIENDSFVEKLISFGFTEEEAVENAKILKQCGVPSIEYCEPTNPDATIDELVAYRWKIDDDRVVWFTVDNRKIFYVALNGEELYDESKGGYLKDFADVHVPETYVDSSVGRKLIDKAEKELDKYFVEDVRYYDAWGIARQDNQYMVRCQISDGSAFTDNWIYGYVWYEQQEDGKFEVTGVKINGQQYTVK